MAEKITQTAPEELSGLVNKLQRFCNREWSHLSERPKTFHPNGGCSRPESNPAFSAGFARYPEDAKALSILAMMDLSSKSPTRYMDKPDETFPGFPGRVLQPVLPRFIDLINKCREAKVNLFLAHQSLGDLRAFPRSSWNRS